MRVLALLCGGDVSPFDGFYERALHLARHGSFRAALEQIQKALPHASPWKESDCLALKAEWLQGLDTEDSLREAIAVYKQLDLIWEKHPEHPNHKKFLYRMSMIHEMLQEWAEARNAYAELIRRTEQRGYRNNDYEIELALYQEGLQRQPVLNLKDAFNPSTRMQ